MLQSAVPLPPMPPRSGPDLDLDQLLAEARALAERVDRRLRERPTPPATTNIPADAAEPVEN